MKFKKLLFGLFSILILITISFIFYQFYINTTTSYEEKLTTLKNKNQLLNDENTILQTEVDTIKELNYKINSLYSENDTQRSIINKANKDIEDYQTTLYELSLFIDKLKEGTVPNGYYGKTYNNYENSISGLSNFLNYGFSLPVSYNLHVFDCSESAAYLEWSLEKYGFDAYICAGQAPWVDSSVSSGHAWIIVKTNDGYRTVIEATALTNGLDHFIESFGNFFTGETRGIVYYDENDTTSINYYNNYDYIFNDIYDATSQISLHEWDWWFGVWGFN